jgi:CheY-like chemotaxis protein
LYQSGAAIIEALADGSADVGTDVGTVPILAAAERGLVPGTVVPVGANYFVDPEHPSVAMLVAPSVNSWQDLEGQFVAVNGKNSLSAKVILLDLKLPLVDGLEVLQRLKGDPRTRMIPVVVLTSSREERDIVENYCLGVNSYITKPVDFEQFTEAVRTLGLYWVLLNQPPIQAGS